MSKYSVNKTYLCGALDNISKFLWYAPYGEALIDEHVGSYENPYKFSGKELDENTGLYDHGARHRDPSSGVWYGVDALFEKYPEISPYSYCGGNPVRFVDMDGREIKPQGERELEMIRNTLPATDRKYVVIGKDGKINKKLINRHNSESDNYNLLKVLVNAEDNIDVILANNYDKINSSGKMENREMGYSPFDPAYPLDKDINFEDASGISTGEMGLYGATLKPDRRAQEMSPDDNIKIIINEKLSENGAAETFAHEVYGHVYLYLKYDHSVEKSCHQWSNGYEINNELGAMIRKSRKETYKNLQP